MNLLKKYSSSHPAIFWGVVLAVIHTLLVFGVYWYYHTRPEEPQYAWVLFFLLDFPYALLMPVLSTLAQLGFKLVGSSEMPSVEMIIGIIGAIGWYCNGSFIGNFLDRAESQDSPSNR